MTAGDTARRPAAAGAAPDGEGLAVGVLRGAADTLTGAPAGPWWRRWAPPECRSGDTAGGAACTVAVTAGTAGRAAWTANGVLVTDIAMVPAVASPAVIAAAPVARTRWVRVIRRTAPASTAALCAWPACRTAAAAAGAAIQPWTGLSQRVRGARWRAPAAGAAGCCCGGSAPRQYAVAARISAAAMSWDRRMPWTASSRAVRSAPGSARTLR